MPWLRLWVDILDDPDLDSLPKATCWAWTRFLAVAKRNDPQGQLPTARRLATILREPPTTITRYLNELIAAGLIDEEGGVLVMHNWAKWQPLEDRTNTERQARHREKKRAMRNAVTPLRNAVTPLRNAVTPVAPKSLVDTNREEGKTCADSCESAESVTPLLSVTPLRNDSNAVTPPHSPPSYSPLFTPPKKTGGGGGERNAVTQAPPPPPPPVFSASESDRVCDLAERLGGDVGWAMWASNRIRIGDTPQAIEAALSEAVNAGKLNTQYVGSILKRYAREGVPDHKTTSQAAAKAGVRPTWGSVTPKEAS